MDALGHLHAAVSALRQDGLPLTLLGPTEADVPAQYGPAGGLGRPQAGRQGLSYYLAAHPAGFVQLSEPSGSFSDTATRSYLCLTYAVGPDRASARALADLLLTLAGDSRTPGPVSLLTPETGQALADGHGYRFLITFSLTLSAHAG